MFFDEHSLRAFIEALRGVGLTCSLSFYELMDKLTKCHSDLCDYRVDIMNTSSQGFWLLFTNVRSPDINFRLEVVYAPHD